MPLNADAIISHIFGDHEFMLDKAQCMLYALSLGLGRDPMDEAELPFVYEKDLRVMPVMPVVMGHPGVWMADPVFGITLAKVVHASQRLEIFHPIPVGERLLSSHRVLEVVDKGEQGAIVVVERTLAAAGSGQVLARMEQGAFCRADGGFGGSRQASHVFQPVPARPPDAEIDMATSASQALWYRLNGDFNPLHASPAFARKAGFERPILHGLCTYGIAGYLLMKRRGFNAPLSGLDARFAKPVYPGDSLRMRLWDEPGGTAFQMLVPGRDCVVLDAGFATFGALPA